MPVLRDLQRERRSQLNVVTLRPWDLAVDPLNRPPLRPFERVEQMVAGTQKIFDSLNGELARNFQQMQDLRLLDLANRKGKAPGGYQSTLAESRLPFIFMNAVGVQRTWKRFCTRRAMHFTRWQRDRRICCLPRSADRIL
jgi:oligoendopeptidase F